MTENLSNETGTQRIAEDDSEWFETLFHPLGTDHAIPTPYQDMNEILAGGLRPGELTVITGRPSMGKTALALDLARHAALRHDIGSLYVSLDSPPSNVWERIYSAQSRTPTASSATASWSRATRSAYAAPAPNWKGDRCGSRPKAPTPPTP